jgi:hypothetical protein
MRGPVGKVDHCMIRIFLTVFVVAIVASVLLFHRSHGSSRNVLANSDDLATWQYEQFNSAQGSMSRENGAIRVDVTRNGSLLKDVLLSQPHLALEPGHRYLLTLKAKADAPCDLAVTGDTGGFAGRHDAIGLDVHFALGTDWKEYDTTFRTNANASHPVQAPIFCLGARTGVTWFKDIEVENLD